MHRRLLFVTITHAVLASFGDIAANIFNLMTVPLNSFFNETLIHRYGYYDAQSLSFYNSLTASLFFIGILIGGFSMGYLMDSLGRKENGVILRSSLGILQGVCAIASKPLRCVELFAFSSLIAGTVCAYKNVLVIYLAECSPNNLRGFTSMAVGSGAVLMVTLITPLCIPSLLAQEDRWMFLPGICALMALAHLFIAVFFPQSPKHLFIHDHNLDKSKRSIVFYHGSLANFDAVEDEYNREKNLLSSGHASLTEALSRRTLRWSLFIVMVCAFVTNTAALNVKSQYQAVMLMSFGFDDTQVMFAMMAISLAASPLCFAAPFVVERLGRRPLFMLVSALCCLEWFFFGCAQFLVDFHVGKPVLTETVSVLGSTLGSIATMMGLLVLPPIIISEVCPHPMRAVATQVAQVVPITFATVTVALYPISIASIGCTYHLIMLTFSVTCLVLLYLYLPEAKGLPVDQIVRRLTANDYHLLSSSLQENSRNPSYGSIHSDSHYEEI